MKDYPYPSPVVAERIQKVFKDNKLTDQRVADAIGCGRKVILAYRNAYTNPSVKFIRYICINYHVDADWLLDLK